MVKNDEFAICIVNDGTKHMLNENMKPKVVDGRQRENKFCCFASMPVATPPTKYRSFARSCLHTYDSSMYGTIHGYAHGTRTNFITFGRNVIIFSHICNSCEWEAFKRTWIGPFPSTKCKITRSPDFIICFVWCDEVEWWWVDGGRLTATRANKISIRSPCTSVCAFAQLISCFSTGRANIFWQHKLCAGNFAYMHELLNILKSEIMASMEIDEKKCGIGTETKPRCQCHSFCYTAFSVFIILIISYINRLDAGGISRILYSIP